jgi:hypothetical protein
MKSFYQWMDEEERTADVKTVKVKLPDGRIVMRKHKKEIKIEGKEHSWKSEGHYTEDGTEWTGPQHAHNGQVMTGEKHSDDSQKLYHYKELSKQAQDKVEKKHEVKEATYQGKKVPLNKPMAGDVKKSKVYVDPDGDGKAKKVNFGDKNMTIKKNIPARRKSFRARHKCDQKKPIDSAGYWSCKAW